MAGAIVLAHGPRGEGGERVVARRSFGSLFSCSFFPSCFQQHDTQAGVVVVAGDESTESRTHGRPRAPSSGRTTQQSVSQSVSPLDNSFFLLFFIFFLLSCLHGFSCVLHVAFNRLLCSVCVCKVCHEPEPEPDSELDPRAKKDISKTNRRGTAQ